MFLFLEEHPVVLPQKSRRVFPGSNSLATRFDSDHPDALVIQKRMEQANGVAPATNASDEQIGQALFAVRICCRVSLPMTRRKSRTIIG